MALLAAACSGGSSNEAEPAPDDGSSGLAAEVASFDVVADRPARFIVGLFASDKSDVLAYGDVTFDFVYPADDSGTERFSSTATFYPIPGQQIDGSESGPRFVPASEALGVYGTTDATFDESGFWKVRVTASTDQGEQVTEAAFEVLDDSPLPQVGDPAPRTVQPLAGDPDTDPAAIDSRAGPDTPIPDPQLHEITVADALDQDRPVMVVLSTPTFCQSRFCGPITDTVADLADTYGDEMAFVHLEIWKDFNEGQLNDSILPWIAPTPDVDGGEPWVFVIDRDGVIVERFDNVATDTELQEAVQRVVG